MISAQVAIFNQKDGQMLKTLFKTLGILFAIYVVAVLLLAIPKSDKFETYTSRVWFWFLGLWMFVLAFVIGLKNKVFR